MEEEEKVGEANFSDRSLQVHQPKKKKKKQIPRVNCENAQCYSHKKRNKANLGNLMSKLFKFIASYDSMKIVRIEIKQLF